MTAPPPFAATPPRGLPELKEHDACALAAFATRDGRPSRAMLERYSHIRLKAKRKAVEALSLTAATPSENILPLQESLQVSVSGEVQ